MVDDNYFDLVSQFKWSAYNPRPGLWYARTNVGKGKSRRTLSMHKFVFGNATRDIDHRDGDGLNNQRGNLRECSKAQNGQNRRKSIRNKSGYKGVTVHGKKFQAAIKIDGKHTFLGTFTSAMEAALVYNEASVKYFGEFARPNIMEAA